MTKAATRPIAEISVRKGVPSWKLPICSMIFEKCFLANRFLFGSKKVLQEYRYLFVSQKKCSWKIGICSVAIKVLL